MKNMYPGDIDELLKVRRFFWKSVLFCKIDELLKKTDANSETKNFDDKMTNGLIFYFKDYNYDSKAVDPEEGSDEYPISKTIRAYYFKNKLIKVIIEDRIINNKETYYYPFMELNNSIFKELQSIKCPEPY